MKNSEFHHSKVKLGKQAYKHDPRTLRLAEFFELPDLRLPDTFDFDHNRRAIPNRMWGNDAYGDCVIAGEANQLLRLERVEAWTTIPLTDDDAINRYKGLTGCKQPGDNNDTGLVILDTNRNWRNVGFLTSYKGHNFKIDAYGELDPNNHDEIKFAVYLLHGVQWGIALPEAAQFMTNEGMWDYNGETGSEWEPGSWGGHCVYSPAYTPRGVKVLTWDMEIEMTWNFIAKYVDEAWGVVDSLDAWRKTGHLDVSAMETRLRQITSKIDQ